MNNLIILPDIHGRTFWKKAVKDLQPNQKVIFLGDYLDPYPYEGITNEQALENFKEILEFKRNNINQVILLIGNHDLNYFDYYLDASRKWRANYSELHDLYFENIDLFDLTHVEKDGEYYKIFSHAGIHLEWLMDISTALELGPISVDIQPNQFISIVYRLNELFHETPHRLFQSLWRVGASRGGYANVGSCVWSDLSEWQIYPYYIMNIGTKDYTDFDLNDIFSYAYIQQIFGHSQQAEKPVITRYYACLDCRKAFKFENDKIIEL